ncbi:MAG: DUF2809 domain-containing protein [Clostridiaceae bacterium]
MSSQKFEARKQRIKYGIAFSVLLCIEVLIAMFIHDRIIRPYVGDILVVIVIYCSVRVIIPAGCKLLPMWIFIFAAFVECMQYFHLIQVLGLENNTFFRILIGSTFDLKDIVCYWIGCMLVGAYQWLSGIKQGVKYMGEKF